MAPSFREEKALQLTARWQYVAEIFLPSAVLADFFFVNRPNVFPFFLLFRDGIQKQKTTITDHRYMQSYIPCSCKTTSKMLGQVNEKEKARKPFFKVVENGKSSYRR